MKKLWSIVIKFWRNTWKFIVVLSVIASLIGAAPVIADCVSSEKKLELPAIPAKIAVDTVIHVYEFTVPEQPNDRQSQQITPASVIEPSTQDRPDIKNEQEQRERQESIREKYKDEMKEQRKRFNQ